MARSGVLNVYIEEFSPRAGWIFKLIFEDLLGLKLKISGEIPAKSPLLNYSEKEIPGSFSIKPSGLLSEKDIRSQKIVMGEYEGLPVFFMCKGGDLPFDPFSMAFYLVSRYEEYLPFQPDQHGRFPHTESMAYKEGFLNKAIVNRLARILRDRLHQRFPDLEFNSPAYRFIPTVDVDIAFAHIGKGLVRTCGSLIRLLLKGDLKEARRRIRTMRGKDEDPYDNFDQLLTRFTDHSLEAVFFILAGDLGPYDRNLSLKNRRFASLIKNLSKFADIGIHPSYSAGHEAGRIAKEMKRLAGVTGVIPEKSRQHFVKMRFPDTYETLINVGIKEDYSMGYASIPGFRAGIASPFTFYNLHMEKETSLHIYPFMFMDTTLSDYLKLKPEDYLQEVRPLIDETRAVGGTLTGIWHNYALEDDKSKHEAFKEILKKVAEQ